MTRTAHVEFAHAGCGHHAFELCSVAGLAAGLVDVLANDLPALRPGEVTELM